MDNQNNWKRPLMVAGIGLLVIFSFALMGQMDLDAITLGVAFLIQSLLSFFMGLGQLFLNNLKKDGLKQILISGVLLLIGLGICSQVKLNLH